MKIFIQDLRKWIKGDEFVSACDPKNGSRLKNLEEKMVGYYQSDPYPAWVHQVNDVWQSGVHEAQLKMCELIPNNAKLFEIGCGHGAGGRELRNRKPGISYLGMDIHSRRPVSDQYICGKADKIPICNEAFDVVVSMFVLEHLIYPNLFLEEAWRILRPGGRFIIIAPDFTHHPICSQNLGISFGNGRDKLKKGRWLDACLTFFDHRIRTALQRQKFKRRIKTGECIFPILLNPRCFDLREKDIFAPDCDAVYWVCPKNICNYLRRNKNLHDSKIFYQDAHTFGLLATKKN